MRTAIEASGNARLLTTVFAVILLTAAAPAAGGEPMETIHEKIRAASTAADHEAIAEWYDRKGAEAQEAAESHQGLADAYEDPGTRLGGDPERAGLERAAKHCTDLVGSYRRAADTYRGLADAHREAARHAK